jgi:hypothetical protein
MDGSATEIGPSSWLEEPTGFTPDPTSTKAIRIGRVGWKGDIAVLKCGGCRARDTPNGADGLRKIL